MRRGVHEHLELGDGEIDFPAVLGALARAGYRGLVAVELPRHGHAAPRWPRGPCASCATPWDRARPTRGGVGVMTSRPAGDGWPGSAATRTSIRTVFPALAREVAARRRRAA